MTDQKDTPKTFKPAKRVRLEMTLQENVEHALDPTDLVAYVQRWPFAQVVIDGVDELPPHTVDADVTGWAPIAMTGQHPVLTTQRLEPATVWVVYQRATGLLSTYDKPRKPRVFTTEAGAKTFVSLAGWGMIVEVPIIDKLHALADEVEPYHPGIR